MAADTIACNVVMVEVGRQPCHCRMAVVACVTTGDMVSGLACDDRIVVTAEAGADHLQMINLSDG